MKRAIRRGGARTSGRPASSERADGPAAASKRTSRRAFLRLVAAGSAALIGGIAAPVARGATPAKRKAAGAAAALTPAMRREITNQKDYVARTLKTLRDYSLPPGSDPGFVFRPLRPSRRRAR